MNLDPNNLENTLFDLFDQIKMLIAPEIWSSILLNCSKNELLVLILIYRNSDVNMTQIAEYLNVPLNTATGIVDRMEKKEIVLRVRSKEDKRIVKIILSDLGKDQLKSILNTFLGYGKKVISTISSEEIAVLGKVIEMLIDVLKETEKKEEVTNTVRKITIE